MEFTQESLKQVMMFDGAMGTMITLRNLPQGGCPEMLNITHAAEITSILSEYLEAGSQIITTHSLGGNAIKLSKFGMADQLERINAAAVAAARQAAGDNALIAGDMGPTGDFLSPMGGLSYDQLYSAFALQAKALADAGADMILIETLMDLAEARVAVLAARQVTNLPVLCSFTYEKNCRTLMGDTPVAIAHTITALGAAAIGINCSGGPTDLLPVAQELHAILPIPLFIQPNAGIPEVIDGVTRFPLDPDDMVSAMKPITRISNAIGGCCGTTPDHIRKLAALAHISIPRIPVAPVKVVTSRRTVVPLQEAVASPMEISTAGKDLYDIIDELSMNESSACVIELSDQSAQETGELIDELQQSTAIPLLFTVATVEQTDAVIRHYHGVTALMPKNSTVLPAVLLASQRYGIHML